MKPELPIKPLDARRAEYGGWSAPAARVLALVTRGWGVSESVRFVAKEIGKEGSPRAFVGIRGAYYLLKSKS